MRYLQIKNIYNEVDGIVNYHGLNINCFVAGSQVYPINSQDCYVATTEKDIPVSPNIIELTEAEYLSIKSAYLESMKQQNMSIEQQLADIQIALAEIMGV